MRCFTILEWPRGSTQQMTCSCKGNLENRCRRSMKARWFILGGLLTAFVTLLVWRGSNPLHQVHRNGSSGHPGPVSNSNGGRKDVPRTNPSDPQKPDTLDPNRLVLSLWNGSIRDPLMMRNPVIPLGPVALVARAYPEKALAFFRK